MFKAALELEKFLVKMDKTQVRRERVEQGKGSAVKGLREETWPGNSGVQGKSWSHPAWNISVINGNWRG